MSLTSMLTRQRRHQAWTEADAAALAVADVISIRQHPQTVAAVIRETRRRYGGADGITREIAVRRAREATVPGGTGHTERTLAWARRLLTTLDERGHSWQ